MKWKFRDDNIIVGGVTTHTVVHGLSSGFVLTGCTFSNSNVHETLLSEQS